jgi:pyridoxal phosphate enzyme (YggS family)
MTTLENRLIQIRSSITDAELSNNRQPGSVLLLAVSKTRPAADLASLYHFGQRHFGESYVQEALYKQQELAHFNITWHFVGPIQSNKTKQIASHFSWVHSVDRIKIAKRLNEQRPAYLPPLNICLQINISDEQSKSGISLQQFVQFAEQIKSLSRLKLRGVMAIPAKLSTYKQQCAPYRRIYQAVTQQSDFDIDSFSFGMTGDLQAAIAEGATIVRIGTALFGPRN